MIQPGWNNHSNSSAKEMTEGKREEVAVLALTPPNITGVILQSISGFIQPSPHNLILLVFLFFSSFFASSSLLLFPLFIHLALHLLLFEALPPPPSQSFRLDCAIFALWWIFRLQNLQEKWRIFIYIYFSPFFFTLPVFQFAHSQQVISTCNYVYR